MSIKNVKLIKRAIIKKSKLYVINIHVINIIFRKKFY